jgi:predicted TIM-barrel fold metal-dependent hydrolase
MGPIISADSHICEPPALWLDRLPQRYRDRAPRVVRDLDGRPGEFFVCEGTQPRSVFAAFAAGVPSEELAQRGVQGFAAAPASVWDPAARLLDQDVDGVGAEVLFPTMADLIFGNPDADFRRACFAAYNDYVAEYCAVAPDRLIGAALLDTEDPAAAVAELTRVAGLGLRAVVLRGDPPRLYGDGSLEPLWEAAVGHGLPIAIHRGAVRRDISVEVQGPLLDYVLIPTQAQRALTSLVFAGVWERHPRLRLVLCEFDLLWLPHFLGRLDRADRKFGRAFGLGLSRPAVDQLKESVWITFQHETAELPAVLESWPADRLMWASDYPHADSTWPHSADVLRELTAVVGAAAVPALVHDTCAEFFGLGPIRSTVDASVAAAVPAAEGS